MPHVNADFQDTKATLKNQPAAEIEGRYIYLVRATRPDGSEMSPVPASTLIKAEVLCASLIDLGYLNARTRPIRCT